MSAETPRLHLLRGADLCAQDLRVDPRPQFPRGKRLDQVVAGARLQCPRCAPLRRHGPTGESPGRRRSCGSAWSSPQQLEPVESGHHHIGDDQRWTAAAAPRRAPSAPSGVRRRRSSDRRAGAARTRACPRCRRPARCAWRASTRARRRRAVGSSTAGSASGIQRSVSATYCGHSCALGARPPPRARVRWPDAPCRWGCSP